jgi:hypothetical protein
MHYLQTDPVILDDGALRQLIGPIHKTPYADGVRQTLAALRPQPSSARVIGSVAM